MIISLISCSNRSRYNHVIKPRLNSLDQYYNFEQMTKKTFGSEKILNNHGKAEKLAFSKKVIIFQNKYDKRVVIFRNFAKKDQSYEVIVCDSNWSVLSYFVHAGEIY